MKKLILKKQQLTEATFEYHGNEDVKTKIDRRVVRALRTAEAAEQAAANARGQGNDTIAQELEDRAAELRAWADIDNNIYRNKGNQDSSNSSANSKDGKDKDNKDTEHTKPESGDSKNAKSDSGEQNDGSDKDSLKKEADTGESQSMKNSGANTSDGGKSDSQNNDQNDGDDPAAQKGTEGDQQKPNKSDGSQGPDEPNAPKEPQEPDEPQEPGEPQDPDDPNGPQKPGKGKKSNKDNKGDPGEPGEPTDPDDGEGDDGEDEGDDEDDDDEGDEGSSEPIDNPFDIDPKGASKQQTSKPNKPMSPQDEFENMKKILKMLKHGERDGAASAFSDILNKTVAKTESLEEAMSRITQDITEISDDEFEDIISATIDAINEVDPVDLSTDIESRVAAIEKDNNSFEANQELLDDDRMNTAAEHARIKQAKQELKKYKNGKHASNTNEFEQMLRLAITNQVRNIENDEDTWAEINRRHQDDDIIAKGTRVEDTPQKKAVSIVMYLDCSGSFNESDIIKERAFLNTISKFVDEGKVVPQLTYFADYLHDTFRAARDEGGTSAWDDIVQDLQATKPMNVIIITDSDMNGQANWNEAGYTAPGCVFYIWKKSDAPKLPERVHGSKGTYEYWL